MRSDARSQRRRWAWAVAAVALSTPLVTETGDAADPPEQKRASIESVRLPANAAVAVRPSQVAAALDARERDNSGRPRANDDRPRGASLNVYPTVAPATVLVRTDLGHGTGWIVDPAGWVITNHHVIEDAAVDPATGAQRPMVNVGRIHEGFMTLVEQGVPALVYKDDPNKDLALLKLTKMPEGFTRLPAIPLAKEPPRAGSECVVIGHPRLGVLWTVRSGEVAGVAPKWPGDRIDVVMMRLTASSEDREKLERLLQKAAQRKVLLSSCGLNPGDSGGPIVNSKGELIGVSFAIPKGDDNSGISVDKFSYHIHLDEVKAFLADRPAKPLLAIPDPWPAAVFSGTADLDKNGKRDTLVFGLKKGEAPTGLLVDLDEDSDPKWSPSQLEDDPDTRTGWDFEFGYQREPSIRTFYDTDNDGKVDLILTDRDNDHTADILLKLEGGKWSLGEPGKQAMFDPALFKDEYLQKRFMLLCVD